MRETVNEHEQANKQKLVINTVKQVVISTVKKRKEN